MPPPINKAKQPIAIAEHRMEMASAWLSKHEINSAYTSMDHRVTFQALEF